MFQHALGFEEFTVKVVARYPVSDGMILACRSSKSV